MEKPVGGCRQWTAIEQLELHTGGVCAFQQSLRYHRHNQITRIGTRLKDISPILS